jgi:hypothetical protein
MYPVRTAERWVYPKASLFIRTVHLQKRASTKCALVLSLPVANFVNQLE